MCCFTVIESQFVWLQVRELANNCLPQFPNLSTELLLDVIESLLQQSHPAAGLLVSYHYSIKESRTCRFSYSVSGITVLS
jgi:hypothetical protein